MNKRIKQVFSDLDKAVFDSDKNAFLGRDEGRAYVVAKIEKELGIVLPESYKTFLIRYGCGGIGVFEVWGIGVDGSPTILDLTLSQRKLRSDFHPGLVYLTKDDDCIYCLDTSRMDKDGECPVVEFNYIEDRIVDLYPDFLSLVADKFLNGIQS